jgi:transposase
VKNLQTTVDHGAIPFIPFKSNTQPDRGTDVWSKTFFFCNYKREEFLAHYHKRSNVESVFQMIKSKFGERLKSKTTTAQVNEALCKVLCHNLCVVIQSMYELNITPEFMSEAA